MSRRPTCDGRTLRRRRRLAASTGSLRTSGAQNNAVPGDVVASTEKAEDPAKPAVTHGLPIADSTGMTLRQAVCAARDQLAGQDDLAPTAARDAELLLLHTLALPRTVLYAYPGRLLNAREQTAYNEAVARRLQREPVQYITGVQEFYGLPLSVTPAVLIPRPETELLVEAVLDRLPQDRPLRIADVGTGSGAIAIALASRMPRAAITAIDLSTSALEVARRNAERHHVLDRIDLTSGDLLTSLLKDAEPFDAIVSNPPYIPETDRASLHAEVRAFEPGTALFAGADGLSVYERLIPQAYARLRTSGLLAMEIGSGQSAALRTLLQGWHAVQFLSDLQGIPRIVLARRA